jgi:hypothetical protein
MTELGGHSADHIAAVWWVAAGIGCAAIVALILIYRRAAAQRELEEAERVLDEAYRDDHVAR